MNPTHYFNIELRGVKNTGHGTVIAPVMAHLGSILHSYFSVNPDIYALDFPELKNGTSNSSPFLGYCIRVFTNCEENCNNLMDFIENNKNLLEYIIIGRIRRCPSESTKYVSLHRFRVAPRKKPDSRYRDINLQKEKQTPYLIINSKSTGQSFSLMIDRLSFDKDLITRKEGILNSYGLSNRKQPLYLPELNR